MLPLFEDLVVGTVVLIFLGHLFCPNTLLIHPNFLAVSDMKCRLHTGTLVSLNNALQLVSLNNVMVSLFTVSSQ